MKKITTFILVSCPLWLGTIDLRAQTSTFATAGKAVGSAGSVEYSIGLVVSSTATGTNGSVAPGTQQPFEISEVSSLDNIKGIAMQCLTYPNPTKDYVKLRIENCNSESLSFQLFDMNGKLIQDRKILVQETLIEMCDLAPSTYYVKVLDNKQTIKSFKIVKN